MLNRISYLLFLGLVVSLPFESRITLFGVSNLQWMFAATMVASLPAVIPQWRAFAGSRLFIAAASLALVYWISAALSVEFGLNALRASIRLTAGVALFALTWHHGKGRLPLLVWTATAVAAALFAILEYLGLFGSGLFRTEDFYIGTTERLTGSFEYPTTAAAFFGLSLPLAWMLPSRRWIRISGAGLLWIALVLTYSRGAMIAVMASTALVWLLRGTRTEWKPVAGFAGIGLAAFGLIAVTSPLLMVRLTSTTSENPFSARYELAATGLEHGPEAEDTTQVTLLNDGLVPWEAQGPEAVVLMSRWFHVPSRTLLEDSRRETALPHDVAPGERVTLDGRFVTPAAPGDYYLIWDLRTGDDWFSRLRIPPTFAEARIADGAPRATDGRDLSGLRPDEASRPLDASVPRGVLWPAALDMAIDHPLLGVGGDNFRLLYGRYLGYSEWDTNIRSNSLYLELLATTGLMGLLAFLSVMASVRWGWNAVSIALGVFLIHGLVDVFLMSTPIYFAFWILVGLSAAHDSSS